MKKAFHSFTLAITLGVAMASGAACSSTSSDTSTTNAGTPAQQGQALVAQRACADCHGAGLSGSDTPQPGTKAYGPNLTPDPDTGIGSWTDAQIVSAVKTGVDDQGNTLCNVMPRFSDLTDAQAAALVAYLRSLAPVAHAAPETDCSGDAGK